MACFYKNSDNKCKLLTNLVDKRGYYINDIWCKERCGENNADKQKQMLLLFGLMIKKSGSLDNLKLSDVKISKKKGAEKTKHGIEIDIAIAQLPPLTQRLADLTQWVKDLAVPFEKQTGLLFTEKQHKLERDETCRQCPYMVKEGKEEAANAVMSCSKCGCRMGKLIADPNEPDPHEIMGKLGKAGKTADAVRIKSASWYAAKKCGNWQEDDRWAEIDAKYLSSEQLKIRDGLYAGKSGE